MGFNRAHFPFPKDDGDYGRIGSTLIPFGRL